HTRLVSDWSSDVCSSDLLAGAGLPAQAKAGRPALRTVYFARSAMAWCSRWTFAASLDEDAPASIFDASSVNAVLRGAPDCFSALVSAARVDAIASAASPFDRSS